MEVVLLFLVAASIAIYLALLFQDYESRSRAYEESLYLAHIREVMRAGQDDANRAFQEGVIRHLISTGMGGNEDE